MSKTIRITLDVELRPLNEDELDEAGIEQLDEDCRPVGDDTDLEKVGPHELADLIAYAIERADDMWDGSSLYAAVDRVSVIEAEGYSS